MIMANPEATQKFILCVVFFLFFVCFRSVFLNQRYNCQRTSVFFLKLVFDTGLGTEKYLLFVFGLNFSLLFWPI